MNHPTRRKVLETTGLTFCSVLFGGMVGDAFSEETTPLLDSSIGPPSIASGESRASLVEWYKQNRATGSQALIAAYGDLFGISQETAMKIACGFSGGIGLTGEVCGMVTAAVMLLGLKYGPANVGRGDTYNNMVELAKQFTKDFRERHKTVICRELIQYDISTPEQYAQAHEVEGIWDICKQGTGTIIDLLENKYDILNRNAETTS